MSTSHKAIQDFIQLHQRNGLSHAVRTAVDSGLLRALAESQKTVRQLADELGLQPLPLQRLMNVLVHTELIEQYGDDYALSAMARLIPSSFLDLGDRYWNQLTSHLTKGGPVTVDQAAGSLSPDEIYRAHKATEEWLLTPLALDVAEVLDVGKSRRGLRILEIGASSAVFSATLAHRDPDSVINLLDTREGLVRSQRTVEEIGIERQVEYIETTDISDLASVPELEGQKFDLVVLAGIIHKFGPVRTEQFLPTLSNWIGGERELVIVDLFPGQANGDRLRALFELELALRTGDGQLFDPAELKELLKRIGYRNLQYAHLPSPPWCWGVVVAQWE